MFVVNSLPVAIIFCVITMLGWGSWANTQKLAGKEKWPFQLFYWDYAIGVFLFSLVLAHTLGSFGMAGAPTRENMHSAAGTFVLGKTGETLLQLMRRILTGQLGSPVSV